MDFDYNDDQRHLRDEARRFLRDACPPEAPRRVLDGPAPRWDRDLWERIAAQGWLGIGIAEEHGGLGLGPVDLGAIAEEIGAALAPLPFGSTVYLLAEALTRFGSLEQQAELLPAIVRGDVIGCAALDEEGGARPILGGALSAKLRPVVGGGIATHAVVSGSDAGGPGLFIVPLEAGEVTRKPMEAIDGSMDVAEMTLANAPARKLARSDASSRRELLARAAVGYAFEQIGGADRCLSLTVDYAKTREAFGGPIGRFQAVKHKLADIFTANEIARSHAYHAAWAAESAPAMLEQAAAAARIAAGEAFWQAAKEMIHLHGAIGFTWEHDAHLFYRRAHHLSLNLGAPQVWKDRLYAALAAAA